MKSVLQKLFSHTILSYSEAYDTLISIMKNTYNDLQVASFLTVYNMRPIHLEELKAFRKALLDNATAINLSGYNTIDLCGTGGDGKDSFNISTLAAFVVAGAGIMVSKHGNYGSSSITGSSTILELLGYSFSTDEAKLKLELETCNICFLHAPIFHPALKQLAPIRKNLGVKTFFNMLGPLVNPAQPKYQFTGVFSLSLARLYNYILKENTQSFSIIHSLDGYDEISLTHATKIYTTNGELLLTPNDFGYEQNNPNAILGGKTSAENLKIFKEILNLNGSKAQENVVLANAAIAIKTAKNIDYTTARALAEESLYSKKALQTLQKLIELQKK